MNIQATQLRQDAELAIQNGRYDMALELLRQGVKQAPDDIEMVTRLGVIYALTEQYEHSVNCMKQALTLEPENGDCHFNLGNAYLFSDNHAKAFEHFVEADRLGCSPEVSLQLNYQMMILFVMRQEFQTALTYMARVEEMDAGGAIALQPDFISKKIQLSMLLQDYEAAWKYAAQQVSREPTVFQHYGTLYSLEMLLERYGAAEDTLFRAEKTVPMTDEEAVNLATMKSSLYLTAASKDPEYEMAYFQQAEDVLEPFLSRRNLPVQAFMMLQIAYTDVLLKCGKYERCIHVIEELLDTSPRKFVPPTPEDAARVEEVKEVVFADEQEYLNEQEEQMRIRFADVDVLAAADGRQVEEDEDGMPFIRFSNEMDDIAQEPDAEVTGEDAKLPVPLDEDTRGKLLMTMITCLLEKRDFRKARTYAAALRESENLQYSYYGRYVEAMSARHLGLPKAQVDRLYQETIAYFRSRTVENRTDALAAVFRARLYAEQGKYAKAREIARMLTEEDQAAIERYIGELKD